MHYLQPYFVFFVESPASNLWTNMWHFHVALYLLKPQSYRRMAKMLVWSACLLRLCLSTGWRIVECHVGRLQWPKTQVHCAHRHIQIEYDNIHTWPSRPANVLRVEKNKVAWQLCIILCLYVLYVTYVYTLAYQQEGCICRDWKSTCYIVYYKLTTCIFIAMNLVWYIIWNGMLQLD